MDAKHSATSQQVPTYGSRPHALPRDVSEGNLLVRSWLVPEHLVVMCICILQMHAKALSPETKIIGLHVINEAKIETSFWAFHNIRPKASRATDTLRQDSHDSNLSRAARCGEARQGAMCTRQCPTCLRSAPVNRCVGTSVSLQTSPHPKGNTSPTWLEKVTLNSSTHTTGFLRRPW